MLCRLGLIAALLVSGPTTASASLTRSKATRTNPELLRRSTTARPNGEVKPADGEFALTSETEVLLDGKPCAYKNVPAGSSVTRIEVAQDRRTVLRIEFKSPK